MGPLQGERGNTFTSTSSTFPFVIMCKDGSIIDGCRGIQYKILRYFQLLNIYIYLFSIGGKWNSLFRITLFICIRGTRVKVEYEIRARKYMRQSEIVIMENYYIVMSIQWDWAMGICKR